MSSRDVVRSHVEAIRFHLRKLAEDTGASWTAFQRTGSDPSVFGDLRSGILFEDHYGTIDVVWDDEV